MWKKVLAVTGAVIGAAVMIACPAVGLTILISSAAVASAASALPIGAVGITALALARDKGYPAGEGPLSTQAPVLIQEHDENMLLGQQIAILAMLYPALKFADQTLVQLTLTERDQLVGLVNTAKQATQVHQNVVLGMRTGTILPDPQLEAAAFQAREMACESVKEFLESKSCRTTKMAA